MGCKLPLLFGTAGVPRSSSAPDTVSGIRRIAELGLGVMEMEFVRGVRMSDALASQVREAAQEHNVALTAHGPYWINLNAKEAHKLRNSRQHIVDTAKAAHATGAQSITFHAASQMGDFPGDALAKTEKELRKVVNNFRAQGIEVDIRPELAGKLAQVGSLDEILRLAKNIDGVMPCVDFSHNHARSGEDNTYEEFAAVLKKIQRKLGKKALSRMHMHVSGIEYGPRGEKKHLTLKDSDFNYKELMRALKNMDCAGFVICESPNLEDDALLLQRCYKRLKTKK
jgi:deoxyribonuclease-4